MATSTDCAADLLAPPNCDLESTPDVLFDRVASDFAAPLARLVRAHEADPTLQQDLLQEVHLAQWRSLRTFDRRCSLRTWVYRVAQSYDKNRDDRALPEHPHAARRDQEL